MISAANSRRFEIGTLTTPSLSELRKTDLPCDGRISVQEIVADVQNLHVLPENSGAAFQVASQFNLLEMAGPSLIPELGVGRYENDWTQGPACAIACGAGTIYRNYFAPIRDGMGQSIDRQIDCLEDIGKALNNHKNAYWEMKNGYALPTPRGLLALERTLTTMPQNERDRLRSLLRIGLHADTEVTLRNSGHRVTQIYCSAMPVAYGVGPAESWQEIATLVLEAAYEATLLAAVENASRTGNNRVFLTMLGGGAFGNRDQWIIEAVTRAIGLVNQSNLEIYLVSYGTPSAVANSIVTQCLDD